MRKASIPCGFLGINTMAEAGAQDNRYIRADVPQFARQDFTRHVGHGLVGDHHVEAVWRRAEDLQGFETTRARHHLVAELSQQLLAPQGECLLIVHKQHTAFPGGERLHWGDGGVGRHLNLGEIHQWPHGLSCQSEWRFGVARNTRFSVPRGRTHPRSGSATGK
jgi:hypothetical protein